VPIEIIGFDSASPHVVFAHDRDDHVGLAGIGDDEIHHRIARVLPHLLADLDHVLALPLPQRGIEHGGDHHAGAAAGSVPLVLPVLGVGIVHVFLMRSRNAGSLRRASI
jgi:hypothetical protein